MKLTWKRDPYSGHWAYGETYGYQLARTQDNKQWVLRVREVITTVNTRHTIGADVIHCWTTFFTTLIEGKTIVQHFEDDSRHDMHNAQEKYRREVTEPRNAAIRAEYDRVFGH